MGKILILVILAVTIPRWALTLQQVDTFALAGIPIAAIGEAVVLELGNFYLLRIYNKCRARAIKYKNDWEALDERNQEQGKTTRKSKTDSVTAGHWILPVALLILEGLTVAAQTPFIAGTLLNQSAADLLKQIHPLAVVGYALLLVVSPGLMTVGIGFGVHYEEALSEAQKDDEEKREPIRDFFKTLFYWLMRQPMPAPRLTPREERKLKKELELKEKEKTEEFAEVKVGKSRQVSTDTAREVMLRDGYHCYYCGKDMSNEPIENIHIDHFIPQVEGGTDSVFNLVVSCWKCNGRKNARMPKTDEIQSLRVHLIKTSKLSAREKILLLNYCGLVTKQRDIADSLGVSPSYVSSSLSEKQSELPEPLISFCEELASLGGSLITPGESVNYDLVGGDDETTVVIAGHLAALRERLSQAKQNGHDREWFSFNEAMEWLQLGNLRTNNIITYGLEHGVLEHSYEANGRNYTFTN